MKTARTTKIVVLVLIVGLLLSSCADIATPPQPAPSPTSSPTQEIPILPTPTYLVEETPPSEATLAEADRILAFGDYDRALELYSVNTSGSSNEIQEAALFG